MLLFFGPSHHAHRGAREFDRGSTALTPSTPTRRTQAVRRTARSSALESSHATFCAFFDAANGRRRRNSNIAVLAAGSRTSRPHQNARTPSAQEGVAADSRRRRRATDRVRRNERLFGADHLTDAVRNFRGRPLIARSGPVQRAAADAAKTSESRGPRARTTANAFDARPQRPDHVVDSQAPSPGFGHIDPSRLVGRRRRSTPR